MLVVVLLIVVEFKVMVVEVTITSTINNMLFHIVQLQTMDVHNVRFVTSVVTPYSNFTISLIKHINYNLSQLLISHVQVNHRHPNGTQTSELLITLVVILIYLLDDDLIM